MVWNVLRTVTDGSDFVIASDHNDTKNNFEVLGGSDGNTKTGPYTIASTLTVSTGGASITGNVIVSSGNVGIGTSSPVATLHTYGSVRFSQPTGGAAGGSPFDFTQYNDDLYLKMYRPANATQHSVYYMQMGIAGLDGGALSFRRSTAATTIGSETMADVLVMRSNGNVGIGTSSPGYQLTLSTDSAAKPTSNTWTISSDARVKTVLGDFTRGLMDIVGLMPKRYHLNGAYGTVDDGREHVSVIAQDVQTTWPAMVGEYTHVEKDEEAGTETETTLLSLNTNELQWALVNAIKELTARVVTLEAQIASA